MGICESKLNTPPKPEENKISTEKEQITINQPTSMQKTQRIPEAIVDDLTPFIKLDKNIEKIYLKKYVE